ncbi:hypothetical protein [Saccharopolyspora gregorii]|uniref:hypothetical protein n=1 Tax=Saccharopolyspora gregorii TaxID=33914 RepID=UPI0021AC3D77|nr:hypothetical protein [Saccharopolyspora gregorii]
MTLEVGGTTAYTAEGATVIIRETASRQQMFVGERASPAAAAGMALEYNDFAIHGRLVVVFSPR